MELTGKIIKVLEKRSGVSQRSGNSWSSQDYVLEMPNGQYTNHMVFNVFGEERIAQFNIQEGQELTVSFDIDANEYQGRWYNSIRAWRVVPAQANQPMGVAPTAAPMPPVQQPGMENDEPDDLPF